MITKRIRCRFEQNAAYSACLRVRDLDRSRLAGNRQRAAEKEAEQARATADQARISYEVCLGKQDWDSRQQNFGTYIDRISAS
jgi:hypothetical protein